MNYKERVKERQCSMETFIMLVFFPFIASAAYAGYKGAPWVPSRKQEVAQLVAYFKNKKITSAIDLGCGTGTILFALAKEHPECEFHGYDLSLLPLLIGSVQKMLTKNSSKNVHFHWKNIFHVNVAHADCIFVFVLKDPHTRIANTLLKHTKKDALIAFSGWEPEGFMPKETITSSPYALPLFIYEGKIFQEKQCVS